MTAPAEGEFRLRSVAVAAYGPSILESIGYGASIPVLPLLARQLGASVSEAAFVAGLLGLGQLAMSLPAGSLIARFGERRAMVFAAVVGAVAALSAGLAPNIELLAGATVLTGMTWSVFMLARQGFMIDAVPAHLRARALSALGGSHRIGLLIGPLLGSVVIAHWGVRSAFGMTFVAALAALLLVLRVPDLGVEHREQSRGEPASMWQVLAAHRRVLATLGLGVLAISGLRSIRLAILPLWADHLGLPPAQVSLLFAIGSGLEIVMFYPAGWVMDHFGRVVVAVPTVVGLAVGLLLLPLTSSFASLVLVTLVMAIGNGLGSGIVMTLGADTAPVLHRAKYLGGWRLCGDLGSGGGPLLISILAAALSLAGAALALGALGLTAAGWIAYWVGRLDRARGRLPMRGSVP